jgi:preprotein translocase subunit SecA
VHFKVTPRDRQVELLDAGKQFLLQCENAGLPSPKIQRERLLVQALTALHCYALDRHYIVADGKVEIVDEFTGRVMPDRAWEGGLHQMIERKEGLEATAPRETSARITYQRLFRRYLRLGGMSGTLSEASGELMAVLGVRVVRVPTYRPVLRKSLPTRLFVTSHQRDAAVVDSAAAMVGAGRAVLIGTRSVAASERMVSLCRARGLEPTLLNARQDADEAAIVSMAGQPGQLTVATNMAGRGTDIALAPLVRDAGGLHVVLTEFHESKRIDRQLAGRAGRQGDPGSWQALVSLDDELFASQAPAISRWLAVRFADEVPKAIAAGLRWFTQFAAERQHAETRRNTLAQEQRTDQMLAFAGRPE